MTVTPELEVEDVGSLILFIDHFLPMVNLEDRDSKNTAITIFKVRETLRDSLGEAASEIPPGTNPCPSS